MCKAKFSFVGGNVFNFVWPSFFLVNMLYLKSTIVVHAFAPYNIELYEHSMCFTSPVKSTHD